MPVPANTHTVAIDQYLTLQII